jgi:NADH-quinone oxidoreductase subunit H
MAAVRAITAQICAASAILGVVLATGSLRLQEVVRVQGGAPWEWYLARPPTAWILFAALVASAVLPLERPAVGPFAEAYDDSAPSSRSDSDSMTVARLRTLVRWAQASVIGGIASALFLGGWQVPGLAPGEQFDDLGWSALGSVSFMAKTGAVIYAIVALRRVTPRVGDRALLALAWTKLVPFASAGLLLHVAWTRWHLDGRLDRLVSAATFAVLSLALVHVALRLRAHSVWLRPSPFV